MSSGPSGSNPLIPELESLLNGLRDAHKQEDADRSERQATAKVASVVEAEWARQFVYELHDLFGQLEPRIAPALGRLVPTRLDSIMNPFHAGTHHDYRTTLRVSQSELHVNACGGTVTVDIDDLRSQRRARFADLDSGDLAPSRRADTLQLAVETFLTRALAP